MWLGGLYKSAFKAIQLRLYLFRRNNPKKESSHVIPNIRYRGAWMAKYNPLHKLRGCPVNCPNDTGIVAIKIDHIFTNFKLESISIWNTI